MWCIRLLHLSSVTIIINNNSIFNSLNNNILKLSFKNLLIYLNITQLIKFIYWKDIIIIKYVSELLVAHTRTLNKLIVLFIALILFHMYIYKSCRRWNVGGQENFISLWKQINIIVYLWSKSHLITVGSMNISFYSSVNRTWKWVQST